MTITMTIVVFDGLRHGELTKLTNRLLQSPTARLVRVWVAKEQAGITRTMERTLREDLPTISVVVPDIVKRAELKDPASGAKADVTLLTTAPSDPWLLFYGVQPPERGTRRIVLSRSVATQLGLPMEVKQKKVLPTKSRITLRVFREEGDRMGEATLSVEVSGVIDTGNAAATAFLDRDIMDAIEDYQTGRTVPRFGWPGVVRPVPPTYRAYLAYSRRPLAAMDHLRLTSQGLRAEELLPERSAEERSYGGLIDDEGLLVYRIRPAAASADLRVGVPPDEIEQLTAADDVVFPWCQPRRLNVGGRLYRIIGCTGRLRWLKERCAAAVACFPPNSPARGIYLMDRVRGSDATADRPIEVRIANTVRIPLESVRREAAPRPRLIGLGVVPAPLLAHVEMLERGEAVWDVSTRTFVRPNQENSYYMARVYARTLGDVPGLDAALRRRGYATESARMQVEENQAHHETILRIQRIVGGVALGACVVVACVLLFGVTNRSRGSIGILRVMGVARSDIFFLMATQALAISMIGSALTAAFGYTAAVSIDRFLAPCVLPTYDLAIIVAAVAAVPLLGVLFPAWHASRIDPAEAIAEGKTT